MNTLLSTFFIPILDVSFDEMMGYPYEHEDEMINEIGNSTYHKINLLIHIRFKYS